MPGFEPSVLVFILGSAASLTGFVALALWRREKQRRQEIESQLTGIEDKLEMMGLSVYGHPSDPNQPGLVERVRCMEDCDEDCAG